MIVGTLEFVYDGSDYVDLEYVSDGRFVDFWRLDDVDNAIAGLMTIRREMLGDKPNEDN